MCCGPQSIDWFRTQRRTPYGMTECLPVADIDLVSLESLGPGALHHLGVCVGSPVDGVELLIDPLDELGVPTGRPTTEPGVLGEVRYGPPISGSATTVCGTRPTSPLPPTAGTPPAMSGRSTPMAASGSVAVPAT